MFLFCEKCLYSSLCILFCLTQLSLLIYEDGVLDPSSIIPLIDGGTEGFKGNARVILPGMTACIDCTLELYPPQVHTGILCCVELGWISKAFCHTPFCPLHRLTFRCALLHLCHGYQNIVLNMSAYCFGPKKSLLEVLNLHRVSNNHWIFGYVAAR